MASMAAMFFSRAGRRAMQPPAPAEAAPSQAVLAARAALPGVFNRALAPLAIAPPVAEDGSPDGSPRSPEPDKLLTKAIELVETLEKAESAANEKLIAYDTSEARTALAIIKPALKAAETFNRERRGKQVSYDAQPYIAQIRELKAELEERQQYLTDLRDGNKEVADKRKGRREEQKAAAPIWSKGRELWVRLHVFNHRLTHSDSIDRALRKDVANALKELEDLRQQVREQFVEGSVDARNFAQANEYLTGLAEEIEWLRDKIDERLPDCCRCCHPLARRVEKAADQKAGCPVGGLFRAMLHPYAFVAAGPIALCTRPILRPIFGWADPVTVIALTSAARCEQRHGCLRRITPAHVHEAIRTAVEASKHPLGRLGVVGLALASLGPIAAVVAGAGVFGVPYYLSGQAVDAAAAAPAAAEAPAAAAAAPAAAPAAAAAAVPAAAPVVVAADADAGAAAPVAAAALAVPVAAEGEDEEEENHAPEGQIDL